MSSSSALPIPSTVPGQTPPIAVITPNDQEGAILVTGGLGLAIVFISLVVRAYVRMGFMQAKFGLDDILIGVAFVCC